MANKNPGGKITGLLALTFEAQSAFEVGDYADITGPYEVSFSDGTDTPIGHISVANKARQGSAFPVAKIGDDVTVEVPGFAVVTATSSAAITPGEWVGVTADHKRLAPVADGAVNRVGRALTGTTGANQKFDYLQTV